MRRSFEDHYPTGEITAVFSTIVFKFNVVVFDRLKVTDELARVSKDFFASPFLRDEAVAAPVVSELHYAF